MLYMDRVSFAFEYKYPILLALFAGHTILSPLNYLRGGGTL